MNDFGKGIELFVAIYTVFDIQGLDKINKTPCKGNKICFNMV